MFTFQQTQGRTTVIESWRGTIERMSYSYAITSVDEVRFSWAFQKQPEDDVGADDIRAGTFKQKHTYARTSDVAYIYSLEVTNTLTGGASACEMCPQGVSTNGYGTTHQLRCRVFLYIYLLSYYEKNRIGN